MYLERAPEESIDRYAGPYERWVFSDELGRPFAFPAIAGEPSGYYTALLEGAQVPPENPMLTTRLPPLWRGTGEARSVTPFAFYDETEAPPTLEATLEAPQQDTKIARLLNTLRDGTQRTRSAMNPRFRVNFPVVPATWTPNYKADEGPAHWAEPDTKPKAIVAVIDDGLPFAHRAFLDTNGKTRVSHCWLQSGVAKDTANVPFGRELVNADIDTLRTEVGDDDAEIYRRAGAVDTGLPELGNNLRRMATHGSHVMGVAAGNAPLFSATPMGDDIQIIAVQLPNTIAWDTSGFGKEMYMLSALHYVFERASRIADHYGAPELPLVVNFSYGWSASRHDGQSEMELAIEELLVSRKKLQPSTALCMPSGNTYGSQMHAVIPERSFEAQVAEIGWHLQPDDRTSSYLEMWFPEGFDPAGYRVCLIPPKPATLDRDCTLEVSHDPGMGTLGDGDPRRFIELELKGQNIGQLSADKHRGTRWRVMAALIPTAFVRGEDRIAPAGRWTLRIERDKVAATFADDQELQVWLQRDDDPSDLRTLGRQSRLVSMEAPQPRPGPLQSYTYDLPQVRGFGALNGVASSPSTTRVAGYVQHTGQPCHYSSAGGLRQTSNGVVSAWGEHADLTAVADQSAMRPGIPSIGVMSGGRSRLVGTSGASPAAARHMVINAAAGRSLMEGLEGALPPGTTELQGAQIDEQHEARVGSAVVPPLSA